MGGPSRWDIQWKRVLKGPADVGGERVHPCQGQEQGPGPGGVTADGMHITRCPG